MAHIADLPTELLLLVFSTLPLPSLIAARGVCSSWLSLIPSSSSSPSFSSDYDIPPARHKLLTLYLRLVHSRSFALTRPHILPHLAPFDRAAFAARLPPTAPDEFRTWVLEWPARAVFAWMWPGLPRARPPVERETTVPDVQWHGPRNALSVLDSDSDSDSTPDSEPHQHQHRTGPRIRRVRLLNPRAGSFWFYGALPFASPLWERTARAEVAVEMVLLATGLGRYDYPKEFIGVVVASDVSRGEVNAVVRCSRELVRSAVEVPVGTSKACGGGWVAFLESEFERMEMEVWDGVESDSVRRWSCAVGVGVADGLQDGYDRPACSDASTERGDET